MPSFVFTTFWTEVRQRGKTVFDRDVCPSTANTLYSSILSRWEHWESRGNKLIASRTFPAPQAAGMSAYNVCVREIIKKNPEYSAEKWSLEGKCEVLRTISQRRTRLADKPANQKGVYSFYDTPPPPHFIIAENCSFPDWNSRVGFFLMPMPIIAPVTLVHLQLF